MLKQLPERLDKNFFVPMTPEQAKHHEENRDVVDGIVKRWKRMGFLSEPDQRRLMIALQNMRMSCDSTYLLDRVTDFGVKADELVMLLEEVFERPEAKVVISASGWACTKCCYGASTSAAGAMCCSTAACPARSAKPWSIDSAPIRPAALFSLPTRAASD